MSRIVRPTRWGPPEVLAVVEVPRPTVPAFGVVVAMRAAGVNPIDWKLYSDAFRPATHDTDAPAGPPPLGLECAGVVTEVAPGAGGAQIGDEVIVFPATAAYADHVAAPVTSLVAKPPSLTWEEAGALMLAGTTAAHALHAASVGAGDTVLVHGGAGGVGLMGIQLAATRGATVVATASEAHHGLIRELGAVPVTYGSGLLERVRAAAPDGIDAALDLAGTDEALDVSLELVADRGRVASIAGSARRAEAGIRVLGNAPGQDAGTEIRNAARGELAEQAGTGALRVVVDRVFALAEAAQAHEVGIAGHAPGKLVLVTRATGVDPRCRPTGRT